jgi:dTDP-4-amino-4,6-dideoxy-D-galactose acyltransferase
VTACEHLPWDTDHFGVRIARVRGRHLDGAHAQQATRWADDEGVDCLYLLADASDPETLRLAAAHGFRFVDVRMTLRSELDRVHTPAPSAAVNIRPAQDGDEATLVTLAAGGYESSRFYADGRFDRPTVDRLYARWMQRSLDGDLADLVLVADADGSAIGYLTASIDGADGVGVIGLVGVAAVGRGAGVGRALVTSALARFADAGLSTAEVVTQGSNVAAQRLYASCGFRAFLVELWYHRWADEARVARAGA